MPRKVTAYACGFGCRRNVLTSKSRMEVHEMGCPYNPDNKACATCENLYKGDQSEGWWCNELDIALHGRLDDSEPTLRRDCRAWRHRNSTERVKGVGCAGKVEHCRSCDIADCPSRVRDNPTK